MLKDVTAPSISELIAALLPAHTYHSQTPAEVAWTWTTPGGIWRISFPSKPIIELLKIIPANVPALLLTGPDGVNVELPRTDMGLEALRTVLTVLGAIGGAAK